MEYLIKWDCETNRYYYECRNCRNSNWCPDHIDFDASYDTDSDVSYCKSAQQKVTNYLNYLHAKKCSCEKEHIVIQMVNIPGQSYSIGVTTVTQAQWKVVMGTEPWKGKAYVVEGDDYPAVYVSWYDAVEFCKKLSNTSGVVYRLPTKEEWGYACRAGTTTAYHFGDDEEKLVDYAWFNKNTCGSKGEEYAHRVAKKNPNAFGLYDMHGNVWEWCSDSCDKNNTTSVLRGGSWINLSGCCSTSKCICMTHECKSDLIGFRLAKN